VFTEAEIERANRAIAPEPPNLRGTALAMHSVAREIDLNAIDQAVVDDEKP
jgi:hypothetical protein